MTVSTEISSNEYTGNGVTTDFDYKFRIFKANQLSVITSDADGDNVVTLRLGTDYTVTGANKSAGGKVILTKPLANGHKISIARDIPIKQETSFRNQSKFFAETHEDAFDYLTMILQRIWGSLGSLYLKRPNILANWFDAKGYRIANLGKPKRDSDAVDLGTLKDEIGGVNSTILKREKRLLRVDDMDISALPKASARAGNVLTFDKDGKPIIVAPATGSAVDVLNQLSNDGGANLIGYKYPISESIKRTVQSKLDEKISILDLGAKLDGVTDDTDAFIKAVAVCDTLKVKLWIPAGTCLIKKPVKSPTRGMYGDSHMSSIILVDIPDATEDTFAITYGAVNEYSNSYGKIHDIKVTVKDELSSVSLIKVNTTSRGAIMQDCTLHVGAGWCVTMEACFYYNYQNVTFEGRYIPKDEITAENELKGGAIRCVGTEINNIHFNNCDIRFLKTVFKGTGQFVGSNSLKVANAAIESIGDNLGDIYGWYVDFDCMYFEGIGLNKHNTDSLRYCFLGTGAGTANFNNCLINLGGTRKDKPVFFGIIGRVSLVRTQMNTSGRTAPIMEPITYSTRSMLEVDNSSCLPPSVVDSLGSQWVGGYRGEGATISPVVSASDIALNTFKFRMRPRIKINSYNNQLIGYVNFSTIIPVIVSIRVAGTIVVENTPKAVEFITYIKFVNGEQVGRSVSVITNGSPDLVGFNPQNGCTMSTYRTSEANNIRSFFLRVGDLIGSATQVDVFLDCEVSLIFESRDTRTSGVVSEY